MRKYKIAFIAAMVMIMALTAGVMGATPSENVRGKEYDNRQTGSCAILCAHGYNGTDTSVNAKAKCYSTMYNRTGSAMSMYAYVAEYLYDSGWSEPSYSRKTIEPGYVVASGNIDRYYNSSIRYYYHLGYVYAGANSSMIIETHDYTANQYYQ